MKSEDGSPELAGPAADATEPVIEQESRAQRLSDMLVTLAAVIGILALAAAVAYKAVWK